MKVGKSVALCAILALAIAGSATANLLLNPGFETQGGGGTSDPANWTRWGEGQVAREGWAARSGSFGLAFYGWTGLGGGAYQDVSIGPSLNFYTFSIWGQRDSQFNRTVTMGLEFYNAANQQLLQVQTNVGGGATWQQFSLTAANPTGAAYARVVVAFPDGGGGQAFKWDDASLTSAPIPEPASVTLLGLGFLVLHRVWRRIRV